MIMPNGVIYAAAKKFAELAVWEWAEAHPDVDVTTILPSFIYGPFSSKYIPLPRLDFDAISTNLMIYNLLSPSGVHLPRPAHVDFRDAARAHIGVLDSKPEKNSRKRVIVTSPNGLTMQHIMDIIKKAHPELEQRFTTAPVPEFSYIKYDADYGRTEEVVAS